MARGLTTRQREVMEFITEYQKDNGYPPSIREIGNKFQIGSLRGVTVHLDALSKKGYIERANTPRSIKVVHPEFQPRSNVTVLPVLGQIAAGDPIHSDENIEYIPVPSEMVRSIRDAYLLRVKGDSMTGAGINPRDLVVIKPQKTANQGDLVAVQIGDEATVKQFHNSGTSVQLLPCNPAYDPIEIDSENTRILGKVIGLLRDYEGMAF